MPSVQIVSSQQPDSPIDMYLDVEWIGGPVSELLAKGILPFLIFLGPFAHPESLVRVQNLTGKSVTFYGADLCNKASLREVFSKVSLSMIYLDN